MIGGHWTGIDEAVASLATVAEGVTADKVVAKAMLDVCGPIANEMGEALYQRVTKVTGETGESIEAQRVTDGEQPDGVVVVEIGPRMRTPGFKARFWEFGTARLAARPFMRPVWDEHESSFSAEVTERLRASYDRLARRRR